MTKKSVLFLLIGLVLIFLPLYLCTRSAWFEIWDFSTTGQIGDTIGGITSPVINLLGAYLVYISFQQQIRANQIQIDALNDEKEKNLEERERYLHERMFNKYISQ